MRIPYVIDNEEHILADVLRAVLQEHGGRALDIASAYRELREGLNELGSVRLLLSHLKEVVEVTAPPVASGNGSGIRSLTREDLRLICFDHVVG